LKLYNRDMPNDSSVTAWSSGQVLTTLSIPNNENFQYDTETISFSTLGLTAGTCTLFELTRIGTNGNDTLSGDWDLLYLIISFS